MKRDICIAIGRPTNISDHDIDVELPVDVDECTDSDELIQQACLRQSADLGKPSSTLSPFIHRTRLKKIESAIQHTNYRVDQVNKVSDSIIADFPSQLEQWRSEILLEATSNAPRSTMPYNGLEFFTIHSHRCIRFLLHPRLTITATNITI